MLKRLVIFYSVLFVQVAYAQKIEVYGQVTDIEGDPAPGVTYYFKGDIGNKKVTGADGKYSMLLEIDIYDTLIFKSVQFERTTVLIGRRSQRKAQKNDNRIELDIVMDDRMFDIFTVRPNVPDTLCCGNDFSIEDFEFLSDSTLVLLTYEKTLNKGAVLRWYDRDFEEKDLYYVTGDAVELSKDYRGNIHLICDERVYLIYIEGEELHTSLENRDYYFKYVAPIIDTIGTNIYFSNYSDIYPAFDYYEFDLEDSSYNVILKVEDTLMMELYRSEFKYVDVRTKLWAHQRQIETGIDKEVWVGATVFTNSIYYEPLYAPLFKTGEDSIVVFDHYKNRMFQYTPDDGFVDSTRISYHIDHRRSGWEQPLLQDQTTGRVYALFLKGGYTYLSEIDKHSGYVKKSFKLYFKYVDRIQIIDDQVFYIYRPFESVQKKFLYREKLN